MAFSAVVVHDPGTSESKTTIEVYQAADLIRYTLSVSVGDLCQSGQRYPEVA